MAHSRPSNLPTAVTQSQFDAFVDGYIETLLYSSNDESDDRGGDPLSRHYSAADLAPDALLNVEATCARFIEQTHRLLNEAVGRNGYGWSNAGGDLWYTSAGHGVGFWDRAELNEGHLGAALTERCQHKEMYVEVGDDGRIYHTGPQHDYRSNEQRIEDEVQVLRQTLDHESEASSVALGRPRL